MVDDLRPMLNCLGVGQNGSRLILRRCSVPIDLLGMLLDDFHIFANSNGVILDALNVGFNAIPLSKLMWRVY